MKLSSNNRFRSYLLILPVLATLLAVVVLSINIVVDPLWYSSGNRITGKNFPFNERLSKLNLFFQQSSQFDCLLFGDSRVTLLDAKKIEGFSCFNMAFSDGLVEEFVEYAQYLHFRGVRPKLVIVGVDRRNFSLQKRDISVPPFLSNNQDGPSLLTSYLTIDALRFSIRSLLGDSPYPRHYDSTFVVRLPDDLARYRPDVPISYGESSYSSENLALYKQLRGVFPNANFIGYIPPASLWEMDSLRRGKVLNDYLGLVHKLAQEFTLFYDFAIASDETIRCDNTYDGGHYTPAANKKIADAINGGELAFGVRVDTLSAEEYKWQFKSAMAEYLKKYPNDCI